MQKFFGLLLFLASVLLPARGLAQESVAVLGLQSVEGDDEIATALGSEIRAAAGEVPGWTVSSNATNIAQMSSGSDCADVDTSCLHRIAGTLQARHIIYGTIHRRSEATSNGWFVNMTHFDDERGEIVAQVTDPFARDTVLSAFAHGLLARLQPAPAEETTQPEPVPTPSNDHDLLRGFAVGLAVLGVGAFGGTIASWVRINDIQHDPRFQAYREIGWPPRTNVCTQAEHDRTAETVRGLCAEASTFEALQVVFLMTAALSAGGSGLLIGLDAAQPETDVAVRPQLGPGRVGLTLDTRF